MRCLLILCAVGLFAGCTQPPVPVEAAQAAFAACVPHEGLNTFYAYWPSSEEMRVHAYCKTGVEVTVPLKAKQTRYELMT